MEMTTIIIIDEITNANAYNTIIRIIINRLQFCDFSL